MDLHIAQERPGTEELYISDDFFNEDEIPDGQAELHSVKAQLAAMIAERDQLRAQLQVSNTLCGSISPSMG